MNNEIITQTFLERLRNNTAVSHKNLEALPLSLSIINPTLTKEDYLLYLTLMHDVVKDAELNIFPALHNIISDLNERLKSSFLESDLAALGAAKESFKKILSRGNTVFSTAFSFGIMYVIEGSSLGGRVILKNITAALGYDEDKGARYFAGYGGTTGSHWKNFIAIMVNYAEEHNCEDEIIAGADFAFRTISNHFTENAPL
jgi:heme oxygenase